jgi:hypothetical protein
MGKRRTEEELIEHLFENSVFDEETGCLLWQGTISSTGYGVVSYQGKLQAVHRLAYKIDNPDETVNVVLHSCDTKNCWRLDHLSNGSYQDNKNDSMSKGRHAYGTQVGTSVLSEDQVIKIKTSTNYTRNLANEFGVSTQTIRAIRSGKMWKHI